MDVVLDRLPRDLLGGLKKRADIDVETDIGECGRNHAGPAVVAVLPQLGDEYARAAALGAGERGGPRAQLRQPVVGVESRAIDAGDAALARAVAAERRFQRVGNLADRGAAPHRLHRQGEQIGRVAARALGQGGKRRAAGGLVARRAHRPETLDLPRAHRRVVDIEYLDGRVLRGAVFVDADDGFLAAVDARLARGGGLLYAPLRQAREHRFRHAAERLGLVDQRPRRGDQTGGKTLNVIRPAERIDDARDSRFLLEYQLGIAGDAGRELGRQRYRLVERVGVQRLRAAERRRQRLDGGARHIVVGILRLQRYAGSLAVGAQHQRARVARREQALHQIGPQEARCAQFRDLHEEIHADVEKERQPRCKGVDVQPARDGGAHILDPVGERIGELLHAGRAGLLHVVAGNRDRVEARHAPGRVGDDVGHDPHGRLGRVDIGVADHELLENVVLYRARERLLRDALLLRRDDVARHDGEHGAVHGHRHAHAVERHAVEEDFHVLDRIDGDAGLADIADDARMVGIVAAVGGQIEGDRKAHLPRLEIAAVEGVGLFGGREARILAHGPRPRGVHGGARPAHIGRQPGQRGEMLEPGEVFRGVERLDGDAFGRVPNERFGVRALEFAPGQGGPLGERGLGEGGHGSLAGRRRYAGSARAQGAVSWPGAKAAFVCSGLRLTSGRANSGCVMERTSCSTL